MLCSLFFNSSLPGSSMTVCYFSSFEGLFWAVSEDAERSDF